MNKQGKPIKMKVGREREAQAPAPLALGSPAKRRLGSVYELPTYENPNSPKFNEFDKYLALKPKEGYEVCRRSAVTMGETCPRLGLLAHGYGIRPITRSNGRDQSSYAHLTQCLLLRGMSPENVVEQIDQILQEVARDSGDPTGTEYAQDASMGYACGCYLHDKLMELVEAKKLEIINIEERFQGELVVNENGAIHRIPFRFQVDFVIRDPKTNGVYIWDTKVIGTSPSLYITGLRLSLQPVAYLLWGRQPHIFGEKLKGFIFGVLQKPTCSRKGLTKGDDQDLSDYLSEVWENLEGTGRWSKLADKRGVEPAISISSFIPSKIDCDIAVRRLVNDHLRRKDKGRNHMDYPKHDQCTKGYLKCDMLSLCENSPNVWSAMIHGNGSKFTTRPDPLDSARLHGATLKPVEVPKVKVRYIGDIKARFKRGSRGKITNLWKDLSLA